MPKVVKFVVLFLVRIILLPVELDGLDTIEWYQQPQKARYLSEIIAKQYELYEIMGVNVPS